MTISIKIHQKYSKQVKWGVLLQMDWTTPFENTERSAKPIHPLVKGTTDLPCKSFILYPAVCEVNSGTDEQTKQNWFCGS